MDWKKLIFAALSASVLAGCSNSEPTIIASQMICSQPDSTYELQISGQTVLLTRQEYLMSWDALKADEGTLDDAAKTELVGRLASMFDGVQGVEFSADPSDEGIRIVLTTDFQHADFSVLEKLGLLDKNTVQDHTVSASKLIASLQKQGFACSPKEGE